MICEQKLINYVEPLPVKNATPILAVYTIPRLVDRGVIVFIVSYLRVQ